MKKNVLSLLLAACCAFGVMVFMFVNISYVQASTNVSIALKNNTKSYNGTTVGMGGTVMPFGYLTALQIKDYNDDDLASLITQFKKTGSTMARLWVEGQWFEPVNDNADPAVMNDAGFTWNSMEMQNLYKYIQAFKDAGVTCFVDIIYEEPAVMYPWLIASSVEPLSGPASGKITEYAEHAAALVKQLDVVKGFTNVKFFSVSGEPNNYFIAPTGVSKLTHYKDSITAIHNRLSSENLLQYVKLIAPEIGSSDYDAGTWISDLATNIPSSIDAYSIHSGHSKQDATNGTFVTQLAGFINAVKTNDPNGADKPFMITDYFSTGSIRTPEDGMNAVAFIANGLRTGVSEFGRWSFAEDIWPSSTNQTSTSFGDYGYGIIGSKQENFTVKPTYKATALAHKFVPIGSTTYQATTSNEAIIPAIIKTANGSYTIIVVNWSADDANATFTLDSSISTTFKKYQFTSTAINMVDKFGELPASFATKAVSGTSFTDTIPANTIYYYTNIPDSTAPAQVTGLSAASVDFKRNTLAWTARTETDMAYYRIYRSETSGFTPTLVNKIGEIWIKPGGTPAFNDKNVEQGKTYYYKVAAVDTSENQGAYSAQASVATGFESYSNTLTVTDSTAYDYYEINADYENGYKVRMDKKIGVIGFVQDKLGYNRENLGISMYSTPMVLNYSSAAYSDQILNGGIESGSGSPTSWSQWTGGSGTFTWDSSIVHSGSRSLKISNASQSDNSTWFQQITSVIAGKQYEVSYWVKTANITGPSNAGNGVYLNIQYLDSSGGTIRADGGFDAASNVGSHGWLNFTSRVTPPVGTVTVQIGAMVYGNSGTAWFDDISMQQQPDIAIVGRTNSTGASTSVTYNNLSATHKQIVTVVGTNTLYYDFYSDRIEMKVNGVNTGGYYIEDGGIVPRNAAAAFWSDGTESLLSDTLPNSTITKNTTDLTLYQPQSAQTIKYEFAASKSVLLKNGDRFRGYYPRFQVNSNEIFTMKFPKKKDNPNGDAESGTSAPTSWSTWSSGSGTFTWDTSTVHWGSKSLKINNAVKTNSAWIATVDNPNVANTFKWSAWIKTASVTGTQGAYISIEAKDAAYAVLATYRIPFITGTNDWKRYELSFNPPAGTVHLLVEGNLYAATGTAWFDDFELNYADTGLHNAGAEIGIGSPTGWSSYASSGTTASWDSTTAYQGQKSLKITNTVNQNSSWITNRTNLQAGKEYEFGGWIKTSSVVAGTMGAQIEAIVLDSNGGWMTVNITPFLSGTNDWTYVTSKITLPPNAVSLNLEAQLQSVNGTAWFDDMFIRLVDRS